MKWTKHDLGESKPIQIGVILLAQGQICTESCVALKESPQRGI